MEVKLLAQIDDAERIVAACARSCKEQQTADEILKDLTTNSAQKSVRNILKRGHEGIGEFSYFIFSVNGISRVTTHQLVRHRMASYLQMSSREKPLVNAMYITPTSIKKDPELLNAYNELINKAIELYALLISKNIPVQDARYLLPNAMTTHICIAMNGRSLNHFFGLRLCEKAQWEIRELAQKMRECVIGKTPSLFSNESRPCVIRGYCPEGDESCGFFKTDKGAIERENYKGSS